MEIKIKSSDELNKLLDALVLEIVDGNIYHREQTLRSMHKTDSAGAEQEAPCTKWAGIDAIRRTAVYVIRMYGGVGGEGLRGLSLSRLGKREGVFKWYF